MFKQLDDKACDLRLPHYRVYGTVMQGCMYTGVHQYWYTSDYIYESTIFRRTDAVIHTADIINV